MRLLTIVSPNQVIWLFASLILLVATSGQGVVASTHSIDLKLGQSSYQVELATTPAQRRKGLMYRKRLAVSEGLMMVYPQPGDHRVWMKNMLIPLRVLWIDDSFTVISVQRLVPCVVSPCPVYSAPGMTRYILELSDDEHGVKAGDKVEGLDSL